MDIERTHAEWIAAKVAQGEPLPKFSSAEDLARELIRIADQLEAVYHYAAHLETQIFRWVMLEPLSLEMLAGLYKRVRQVAEIGDSLRYVYDTRESPPSSGAAINNLLAVKLFVKGLNSGGDYSLTAHGKQFVCSGVFLPRVPGKKDPNRARLFSWLRENGGGDIIFEDVGFRDLGKFVAGKKLPEWLQVYAIPTVQIRSTGEPET